MTDNLENLLTEKEVAEKLKISLSKLQQDRANKRGLPFIRVGGAIRYSPKQIEEYCRMNTVEESHGG